MNATIIKGISFNPYINLALEEVLLNQIEDDELILYLWQNQNTIVIGYNQNPYIECYMEPIENNEVILARRLSGGGAVYHDLGNLNFTFIGKDSVFDISKNNQIILEALASLNIDATISGRNDLTINGLKFSGHAYYQKQQKQYHHGTIMVHVDKEKLSTYLKPHLSKLQSHQVKSVKSRVMNLVDVQASIRIDDVSKALIQAFSKVYSEAKERQLTVTELNQLEEIMPKYASREWLFPRRMKSNFNKEFVTAIGVITIEANIEADKIKDIELYSDMMNPHLLKEIKEVWINVGFEKNKLLQSLKQLTLQTQEQEAMVRVLTDLFMEEQHG